MPRTPIPRTDLCGICGTGAQEPPRNPTPIISLDGTVIVCAACRQKARRGRLVEEVRAARTIRFDDTPPDPRIAIAHQVENAYTVAAIRGALEAEDDPWRWLAILDERLVQGENTNDRLHDAQQFRPIFFDKLVAMPTDGE